ncbi:MAG TPA: ribosome small subunit-dependent GTPase A [Blastocatellia bacterium]|jgi:ribosome biogenesis GTPase
MYDLKTLGWNSFFEKEFEPHKDHGHEAGRVALEYQGIYRVFTDGGELLAELTGKLRFQAHERADFPAVGDWVVITRNPSEGRASIHAILPRLSKFSRKAAGEATEEQIVATNVDTIFLVQGLDKNYNLRRIERYVALAQESGSRPVIILSKADLSGNAEGLSREVAKVAPGVPVHVISSKLNQGLDPLYQYLGTGLTVGFIGSSGVGKSTLINRLLGKEQQKTQEVREEDSKGRHTTVHRELIVLPRGGLLIDTPGMRELRLWDSGEGLTDTFSDIETFARDCYFGDCRHENEPDCAVKAAVAEGMLDAKRLESYKNLQAEKERQRSRQDVKPQLSRKEKTKLINKTFNKTKPRR